MTAIENERQSMHILFSPILGNLIWVGGGSVGFLLVIIVLILLVRR